GWSGRRHRRVRETPSGRPWDHCGRAQPGRQAMRQTSLRRPPAALRLDGSRLWDVVAGHVVPGAVFALCLVHQASNAHDTAVAADAASLLGLVGAVWSLGYLRRSFAILPQARRLVTGGPYGLSRNPLYVAEVLAAWSVYLPTMSWPAVLLLTVNVALLLVRVR